MKRILLLLYLSIYILNSAYSQTITPVPAKEAAVSTWQVVRGSQQLEGVQRMKGNFTNTPVIKWKAQLNISIGGSEGEPIIGDVNGDGRTDVLQVVNNGSLFACDGHNGTMLWQKAGVADQVSSVI